MKASFIFKNIIVIMLAFVLSCNSSGDSQSPPPEAPEAPTGVSLSVSGTDITVTWNASERAASYEVYFSKTDDSDSATECTTDADVTDTICTVSGLEKNIRYYFWVKAVNSGGKSLLSQSETEMTGISGTIAYGPKKFYTNSGIVGSIVPLSNNRFVVIYRGGGGSVPLLFRIYDYDGQVLVSDITAYSNSPSYVAAAPMGNDRFLIIYSDSSTRYCVYNDQGTLLTDNTGGDPVLDSIATVNISAAELPGQGAVIAGRHNTPGDYAGKFFICSNTDYSITSAWDFDDSISPADVTVSTISSSDIFIGYNPVSSGKYAIHKTDGSSVTAAEPNQPLFASGAVTHINSTHLSDGRAVIVYTHDSKGKYSIINSDGSIAADGVVFRDAAVESTTVSALAGGRFLIAYKDTDGYGKFMVLNSDGSTVIAEKGFETATGLAMAEIYSTVLPNGSVVILYSCADSGGSGNFVIIE